MRILTTTGILAPAGGIEVSTFQGSDALARRGHHVDVLYGAEGPQRADYERAGLVLHGPFRFGFDPRHPLVLLRGLWSAARLVRRLRPDVLWLHRPEHIIWAQFVARFARVPIACHLHHAPNYRLTRLLMTGVPTYIAVSEFTRQAWIAKGVRAERISVLHNAIPADAYPLGGDAERQAARVELGLDAAEPVTLYYGRVTEEKGVLTLIEAWRRFGQGTLLLVGSPSPLDDPTLRDALATLEPGSWRWYPSQSEVIRFLHSADLVVVPSWWEEPFGRVVIEAMSTGRPVIGTRAGGIPEILHGPMSRFLVDPRDADALVERIRSTIGWRTHEPTLGAECREWVDAHFSFEAYVDQIEGWLERVARTPRVAPDPQGTRGPDAYGS